MFSFLLPNLDRKTLFRPSFDFLGDVVVMSVPSLVGKILDRIELASSNSDVPRTDHLSARLR